MEKMVYDVSCVVYLSGACRMHGVYVFYKILGFCQMVKLMVSDGGVHS